MQKPLAEDRQRLADTIHGFTKIVPEAKPEKRLFRIIELSKYIQRRELTESLEILEESGIGGQLAILAISCLQKEVAA